MAYERSNRGQPMTYLGRSDLSGGYTYSSRGGSSGGRWDTRSTGSSDREGDFPDRESLTQGKHAFFSGKCLLSVLAFLLAPGTCEGLANSCYVTLFDMTTLCW